MKWLFNFLYHFLYRLAYSLRCSIRKVRRKAEKLGISIDPHGKVDKDKKSKKSSSLKGGN